MTGRGPDFQALFKKRSEIKQEKQVLPTESKEQLYSLKWT
jgi:hypothetical protein